MIDAAEVAAKYAPIIVLHGDDKLGPSSADWFVERSELRWSTGRSRSGVAVDDSKVDGERLGAAAAHPYRHDGYAASALTRPLESHPTRPTDLPLEQGFFLRLRDERFYRGDDPGPVYWDYDDTIAGITYWLFYPASSPPLGILRAGEQLGTEGPATEAVPDEVEAADAAAKLEEFRRAYPGLAAQAEPAEEGLGVGDVIDRLRTVGEGVRALLRRDNVLHEGDWERLTVYLDVADRQHAQPAGVGYYRHSTTTFDTWDRVEKEGTHPVAYSAIGSHATLPSPNFGFIDVGDRNGPRWRAADQLAQVEEQPWYGFGGAWGRVGKVRESTGPLGPGAHWKHPAPRPQR